MPRPRKKVPRRRHERVVPHQEAARLAAASVKLEQARRAREARDPLMNALQIPFIPKDWTDDDCAGVIVHLRADWHAIQGYFQGDRPAMERLIAFRKSYIDGLINELAADKVHYPGLIARASGSVDLASDYDVTLATTEPGDADIRAARELSRRIKEKFGKQSATVFDTNFYLCDFIGEFANNIVRDKPDAVAVARTSPGTPAYQDVLALLKVRRYMHTREWLAYANDIAAYTDPPQDVIGRLQAVETTYHTYVGTLVAEVSDTLVESVKTAVLADLDDDDDKLHALDAYLPDRVRAIADELSYRHNTTLRALQKRLAEWTANDPLTREELRVEIERETGAAAFFASEAYHTEGSLLQIVVGRKGLLPEHYLDSLNEQFGDFLKDVRHYTGERDRPPEHPETDAERARRREFADGVMYFRGAKYMSRLLQSIMGLQDTIADVSPELRMLDGTRVAPDELRTAIETRLMPLRRNKDERPIEERSADAQVIIRDLFPGVDSPEDLKVVLMDWVARVNSAVRSLL